MLKKLLFFSLMLFVIKINAQQKPKNLTTHQHQLDSILNAYKTNNKLDSFAILAHDASVEYYKKRDFDKAIIYAKKEVNLGQNVLDTLTYKKSIYQLGYFYYLNKNYSQSIKNLKKVIDSFDIDITTYKSYCQIARNYNKLGDFYQAINYYKKGLSKKTILKTSTLIDYYNDLAIIYYNIGTENSLKEQFKLLKKMDTLISITNPNYNRIQRLDNAYANYYNSNITFNYNKSKLYYLKILSNATKHKDSSFISISCANLGLLFNKKKNDSAYYFLKKGIKYAKPNESSNLYFNLAEYFYINEQYTESLNYLHKVLLQSNILNIDSSYAHVPKIKDLTYAIDRPFIINTLKDKTKNFLKLHEASNDRNYLELALKNITLADHLITTSRENSFEDKSKLVWQEAASELYMLAVKTCFKSNKPKDAFYFIEKNKALLLLDNISDNRIKSNIAVSILQEEQNFKNKISASENKLNNNPNEESKDNYNNLKIEYSNFMGSLKENYPEYYSSKQPVIVATIESVKNNLDSNTTILEYILNKNEGYLLAISKNDTQLLELNEVTNLGDQINAYLKLTRQPITSNKQLNNYKKLSNKLHNILFPFKNKNILKNKLLIIPDYTLQNLPFESLKNNTKYLIEDYELSYAYSISFLITNKKLKRETDNSFLGFAPQTFNYDKLQDLPRSNIEVQLINQELNGTIFLDSSATKTNFLSKIKDSKIIHLSTHANANDSISPWIAFKNEKLYLNELYTIKNQAELVVLNACNSSLGQISAGEGVFSLARGFFYSGANSVISSLWNVNDKSNSEITTSFYSYLKDGKTKSASLRQAKLDYLKTHSLSETSPYYWSSLILIGDNSSIRLKNNTLNYIILSVLLLMLLFFCLKKIK